VLSGCDRIFFCRIHFKRTPQLGGWVSEKSEAPRPQSAPGAATRAIQLGSYRLFLWQIALCNHRIIGCDLLLSISHRGRTRRWVKSLIRWLNQNKNKIRPRTTFEPEGREFESLRAREIKHGEVARSRAERRRPRDASAVRRRRLPVYRSARPSGFLLRLSSGSGHRHGCAPPTPPQPGLRDETIVV